MGPLSSLHHYSRDDLRHWVVANGVIQENGFLISIANLWGNPLTVNSGSAVSIAVVLMPTTLQSPSITQPMKVRVHEIYAHIFEGDISHDGFMTLELPDQTLSGNFPVINTTGFSSLLWGWTTAYTGLLDVTGSGNGFLSTPAYNDTLTIPAFTTTISGTANPITFVVAETQAFPAVTAGRIAVPAVTTAVTGAKIFSIGSNMASPWVETGSAFGTTGVLINTPQSGISWLLAPEEDGTITEPGSSCVSEVVIGLYVSVLGNNPPNKYSVKDPSVEADASYDYLDLKTDVYIIPTGFVSGYSGREWVIRLPHPIDLGIGEALLLTIAFTGTCGSALSVIPFVKALISEIS